MRTVWAVICGTLRDEVDFRLMLDYLLRCRDQGIIQGIVLSTWRDEVATIPGLDQQLAANHVAVVTSQPLEKKIGRSTTNSFNYWRQATQLQAALDLIPDDAIVIKTRTDRALPATRKLMKMLDEPDPLPLVREVAEQRGLTAFPQEFHRQIAIFKARSGRLVQFADFAFMGYREDMAKLINFDAAELYLNRELVANIQFFIYPFVRDYPVLRDYYRVINFRFLLRDLKTYTEQGGTQFPQFFQRLYAAYFGLLATHFRIGTLVAAKSLGKVTLPIEFSDFFHSGQAGHLRHNELGVTFRSQTILDQFLAQPVTAESTEPKRKHWWRKSAPEPEQPPVKEVATKNILQKLQHPTADLFGRMTSAEYQEMQDFRQNKDFSPREWLRPLASPLADQPGDYAQSVQYQLPGITPDQAAKIWRTCERDGRVSQTLLDFWLEHDLQPADSAPYLMSSARTGNRFSTLVVGWLLRQGVLSPGDQAEALRITDFFGRFHMQHHRMDAETAGYILARYLYFVDQGKPVAKNSVVQTKFVFQAFFPTGFKVFEEAVGKDPQKMIALFDAEIERLRKAQKRKTRQRVVEMALEITHDVKYWTYLQKFFNGRFKRYEQTYTYLVKHQLFGPMKQAK